MGVFVVEGGLPVVMEQSPWPKSARVSLLGPSTWVLSDELSDPMEVWRTQRSVRTVVGFLARNIAQVALHAFEREDDGDRDRLGPAEPLSRLLKRPSPTQTGYEFMSALVIDVCLWERFAALIKGDGDSLELVRIPPNRWRFNRDPGTDQPTSIQVLAGDGVVSDVPLSEALWLDGYPMPDLQGCSPLNTLRELLIEERESGRYRRELWENGARMPGWISRPNDAPPWSSTGRTKFRAGWQEYAADGLRAGRTPLLEEGMEYHELTGGITPENAQQLEARKFSIAEVAAAYFVPPVFVGVMENANYSNVVAYREILYSDTLGPWFQQVQQAYDLRLLMNKRVQATALQFVEFNVGEKLRMSFDEQAKIFQTATGGPTMTRNEARQRMNLPRIDGADELIVPLNVVTGGQASPTDSGSQNEE